jgi:uncharacterized protein (TIGR00251 family)
VIRATSTGIELDVRVIPRAKRTAFDGERGGALLVRLAAAPVDDAANQALIGYLAHTFGVSRHAVRIISGQRGRRKRVAIEGVSADSVRELIRGADIR